MDWMPQTIREGIFTILFISGPLVILAAGLGLTIGILQAATQVQEQTLGSAVKIIGLFIALIIFGFYIFQYMQRYTTHSIERAFKLVPSLGSYVKPRRNFLEIPLEETQDATPQALEMPEQASPAVSGSKLGNLKEQPEEINVNKQAPAADKLNPPKSQIKEPDTRLKSQPLAKPSPQAAKPVAPQAAKPVAQQPAARPAAQATQSARPATPQAARPVTQAPQPARPATQAPQPARPATPIPQTARPVTQAPRPTAIATPAVQTPPVTTTPAAEPKTSALENRIKNLKRSINQDGI